MSLPISLLIYGTNVQPPFFLFFFFNDTATTEIYTLSLHDALPISVDSIPAVFGITEDPFIVYTSNVLAILGLRALYFLLAGVIDRLRFLDEGLAVVLVFFCG